MADGYNACNKLCESVSVHLKVSVACMYKHTYIYVCACVCVRVYVCVTWMSLSQSPLFIWQVYMYVECMVWKLIGLVCIRVCTYRSSIYLCRLL